MAWRGSGRIFACFLLIIGVCPAAEVRAERVTVPLDGTWQIDESEAATEMPRQFRHTVPVPGLANLAQPAFVDVDRFDSRLLIDKKVRRGMLPESARITEGAGISRQGRNYFWYTRTFTVPVQKQTAILRINKAQFGTKVWLNGHEVGEHLGCFTAGIFDVTHTLNWAGDNRLVVRIGAHPGVMPASIPAGADFEKNRWTPGIYDSVSLELSDNPVIETVQIAPRTQSSEIVVQAKIKNYAGNVRSFHLSHTLTEWKSQRRVMHVKPMPLQLRPGEERTVTQTIPVPNATLWSPENPFLYELASTTGGDRATTRFGMRDFRCDTATRRCYLNGRPIYLRGSNITLHRFFEDPQCGALPWDEAWLQKLLVELPRQMHWNSFRFCIGPVPDRWLQIADEAGLLIQHEYFIWSGPRPEEFPKTWTEESLVREFTEFMRDSWNHPSVVIWDACNETRAPILGERVIPRVRGLDLSSRPWDNGYNPPAGPNDPVENHPYERVTRGDVHATLAEYAAAKGNRLAPNTPDVGHATIINEYGWLWVNRDGTPTELTEDVYRKLLGENATPSQRIEANAYYLAALTEFWRAHRKMAGVQHFVYLTGSYPGAFTADHFADVEKLEFHRPFAEYVSEAFKPLGVYLNVWERTLPAGVNHTFAVMLVNDRDVAATGRLTLTLEGAEGRVLKRAETSFSLEPLGQQTLQIDLPIPETTGPHRLKAVAQPSKPLPEGVTISRRNVELVRGRTAKPTTAPGL